MEILSNSEIWELTADELRRISVTLMNDVHERDPTVVNVGFGLKNNSLKKADSSARIARFEVNEKRNVSKTKAIPTEMSVRLKRGPNYVLVNFPTDVVTGTYAELTSAELIAAGRSVSASAVVRWTTGAARAEHWGLITASHFFERNNIPRTHTVSLRIGTPPPPATATLVDFTTKNHRQTLSGSNKRPMLDAAVVEVSKNQLGVFARMSNCKVMSVDELANNATSDPGQTFCTKSNCAAFTTKEWRAMRELDGRKVNNVLEVKGPSGSFKKGTSGSCWGIGPNNQPAAVQFGGGGVRGFAQSLDDVVRWAKHSLKAHDFHVVNMFCGNIQITCPPLI